jgi:hypothetical protein
MASNDELDRRIDNALAGYAGAEPLAGLEERVLRRVRVASRRRAFGWAAAIAVAAALVVTVIVVRAPHHVGSKSHDVARVETSLPPRPTPVVEKPRVVPNRRVKSRLARLEPLPKLEQFPTPVPLTAEERALVAFVTRYPKEAQQAFEDLRKRSEEPIEIQPIQIPSLEDSGAQ